jgi:hypothetical protein
MVHHGCYPRAVSPHSEAGCGDAHAGLAGHDNEAHRSAAIGVSAWIGWMVTAFGLRR